MKGKIINFLNELIPKSHTFYKDMYLLNFLFLDYYYQLKYQSN